MRYIDRLGTIPDTEASNALILGTALHEGIEKGVEAGIKKYYSSFPIIDDSQINEAMKLEFLIPKVQDLLPKGKFELKLETDDFVGFVDLIVETENGVDIYDFKYSNNVKNYLESRQLSEYQYFFQKCTGRKVNNLYFVFVPKIQFKQKKNESLLELRQRIMEGLQESEIRIEKVPYDPEKVIEFYAGIKAALEETEFPKEKSHLCNWCEYQQYCWEGLDYMILPKNERRNVGQIQKKVLWLYGAPFSGKTFLANRFPDPLMLNTDGNIRFVDAPYVSIKDEVVVEGRMTKRTLGWQVFKDSIAELEKKQNDFKTIVVDLLEDTYEQCRLFMYDQMGISHESDDSFRAWDKVRTEFLSTLKRLINLDYENIILISHEDTSKDITKKGGDRITAIKPNLQEKTANKVAGMVDIVARVIADGEDRTLNFKTNEVIFGGGRLNVTNNTIPLEYDDLMKVYEEANQMASGASRTASKPTDDKEPVKTSRRGRKQATEPMKEEVTEATPIEVLVDDAAVIADLPEMKVVSDEQKVQETEPEVQVTRTRKSRRSAESSADAEPVAEKTEEAAPVRTRKKRSE